MKTVSFILESISPYSQSRPVLEPKLPKELPNDYEERTWRHRMHVDADDNVFIPPMAFKNAISEAAQFLSIGIEGKGKATWTKHFLAGIIAMEPMLIGIKAKDVVCEKLFVPSDGKRGGGTRVWKYFPLISKWRGSISMHIVDDMITEHVFRQHLEQCGQLIGIGRFRPRNGGFYGRFRVAAMDWQK